VSDSTATTLCTARALVADYRAPARTTQRAYMADVARLVAGSTAIRARRTSDRYRAAWVWYWRRRIVTLLASDSDAPETLAQLRQAIAILQRIPAGSTDPTANLRCNRRTLFRGPRSKTSPQRDGLAGVSSQRDWRNSMIHAADSFVRPALLLLALSGLRPCELDQGVVLLQQDDLLWLRIRGGKVTQKNGQPHRTLAFSVTHPWARQLATSLDLMDGAAAGYRLDRRRLQRVVARAAEHCMADVARRPSCLSFRHQFASGLKRAGFEPELIGAALGHASVRTQGMYGRTNFGRGGNLPIVIAVPRPVRCSSERPPRAVSVASRASSHIVSVPPAIAATPATCHVRVRHAITR
jgi:integrase